MTAFADYFWGEKNNGFDVLYHNMKYGLDSSKEFADFLRESWSIEETYVKLQQKLAAKISTSYGNRGSFGPYWLVLKTFIEKIAGLHQQLLVSWQEQLKEVQKYTLEQQKTHKEVKDHEASTIETVQGIQQTIILLQKAKESYHARCIEYEKLRRENASVRDLEKVDVKFKKANDDYRSFVEKYANVRNDFEAKMTEACKRFQDVEENHLQQMRVFVDVYVTSWKLYHTGVGQMHDELVASNNSLTVDKLIDTMVQSKTTGMEKPGPIELEETDFSSLPPPVATPDPERRDTTVQDRTKKEGPVQRFPMLLDTANHVSGFLTKRKKKKKKMELDKEASGDADLPDADASGTHLDEEGFTIRPDNNIGNHDSDSSSSGSDSDIDDRKLKLKVEIKPFSPNDSHSSCDNVDNIRSLVKGLQISATPTRRTPITDPNSTYSTSALANSRPSQDLWDLDIFNNSPIAIGSPISSRNNSTCRRRRSPATGWTETSLDSSTIAIRQTSGTPTSMASNISVLQGFRSTPRTTASASSQLLSWQPSADHSGSNAGLFDQIDSTASCHQSTPFSTSLSFGSSRGPSPLSAGSAFTPSSDVVPLAVAFCETVHAYFSGADDARCKVRMTGEMVVSFPSGVVQFLRNNPSLTSLSFRVRNLGALEDILHNKQLVTENIMESSLDSRVYSFDVSSLAQHLEKQSELNHTASYFNIDVLKYKIRPRQPEHLSAPLRLRSCWTDDILRADFRLDYSYNSSSMSPPVTLSNVIVHVPVNGDVTKMQCKPPGIWSVEKSRAIWNVGNVSDMSESGSQGCVRAKFDLSSTPTGPHLAAVQFTADGTTVSGVDFDLLGNGYRTSLVKRRLVSGKYLSEAAST